MQRRACDWLSTDDPVLHRFGFAVAIASSVSGGGTAGKCFPNALRLGADALGIGDVLGRLDVACIPE
jgi:hypothetical protein